MYGKVYMMDDFKGDTKKRSCDDEQRKCRLKSWNDDQGDEVGSMVMSPLTTTLEIV